MLDIVMAILSTWRLTQIVTEDSIFDVVRKRFHNYPKVLLFFQCSRCVSVWCGGVALVTYTYAPLVNYIFAFSMLFGVYSLVISWIGAYIASITDTASPKIILRPDQYGGTKLELIGINQFQAHEVINGVATEIAKSKTNG